MEHGQKLAADAGHFWGWASPAGKKRAVRRFRMISECANLGEGKKVLEIGCGTGIYSKQFTQIVHTLVAQDLSYDLLSKVDHSEQLFLLQSDAEILPFPNCTFDAVIGSSILHHLRFDFSIAEIYRVLIKGGRIAFAEPNMMNPQILMQKNIPLIKNWMGDSPDETAFFRRKVADQLEKQGFNRIQLIPFDFLHPLTPPKLIPIIQEIGLVLEKVPFIREIAGSLVISAKKG